MIFWKVEIQFLNILKTESTGAHVHQICFRKPASFSGNISTSAVIEQSNESI
jgi:hypothetical protein